MASCNPCIKAYNDHYKEIMETDYHPDNQESLGKIVKLNDEINQIINSSDNSIWGRYEDIVAMSKKMIEIGEISDAMELKYKERNNVDTINNKSDAYVLSDDINER